MKDIVLIVGQIAVGKTTASSYLMQLAREQGIAYEPTPIDDFPHLFEQVWKDDISGGHRHYHDWSGEGSEGHSHAHAEPYIPFVVTHTDLVDGMYTNFFNFITEQSQTGKLRFVEWTGGKNTNPPDRPAARADFSFTRAYEMIKEGHWSDRWLERILAIVHITADRETQLLLNTKNSEHPSFKESSDQVVGRRIKAALDIFGEDDFSSIKLLFRGRVDNKLIFDVCNKGGKEFYDRLEAISDSLFKKFKRTPSRNSSEIVGSTR